MNKVYQAWQRADPELRILYASHKRTKVAKSNLTTEDWEKAQGVVCRQCNSASLRIFDGLCPSCYENIKMKAIENVEDLKIKRYYKMELKRGRLNLSRMRDGLL